MNSFSNNVSLNNNNNNNENNRRNSNSNILNISPAFVAAISDDQTNPQPLPVETRSQPIPRTSPDTPDSSRRSSNTNGNRDRRRRDTHRSRSATAQARNSVNPTSQNPATSSSRNHRRRNHHADNHHSSSHAQRTSRNGDNGDRTDHNTDRRNHARRSSSHHLRNNTRQNTSSSTTRQPNHNRPTARVSRLSDHRNPAQEGHSRVTATDHRRHGRHIHRRREISRNPINADDRTNTRHVRLPGHVDSDRDERTGAEHRIGSLRLAQPTTSGTTTGTGTVLSSVPDQSTPASPSDDRAQYSGESRYDALYRRLSARIGDRFLERTLAALNDQVSDLLLELVTSIHESIPVESMFDSESQQGATDVELSQLATFTLEEWPHDIPQPCDGADTCVICTDRYGPNATLTRLSCGHVFHRDCVSRWLGIRSSCPMCREPL